VRLLMLGPLGPPHVADQAIGLSERGFEVEVGGNAQAELDDHVIEKAGIPVHRSPPERRSTPWGIAGSVRWARRVIAAVEPDVVNAHWLPGFGFAAAAAGASPLALTAWGSDVYRANLRMRLASRFAVRRAGLVLADSRDLLSRCVELGADPSRAELIQWGVDLSAFAPASRERAALKRSLGLGPGPVILSPRSLMPVYNVPVIVRAFGIVGERFADAQLVIKHMGYALTDLPELPHPERVHVVGNVPYERMADYYRAADVCVSVPTTDGTPRSVLEALACEVPCVITDLPWFEGVLDPGADVLAVPVGEAEALASAIAELLADPARAAELGARGRERVVAAFDRRVQLDRLAALLTGLAA
jgi:glycosyltransferase involved in cell wall biosynthesis